MDIIFLLLGITVGLVGVVAAVFWWAVQSGQFDDLETPAYRVLDEED